MQSVTLRPPSSLVLIADRSGGVVPTSMGVHAVAATPSCVAVGTLSELDGETSVSLGRDREADVRSDAMFVGLIELPTGVIAITTALGETLLEADVGVRSARLTICGNDEHEPRQIVVLVGVP